MKTKLGTKLLSFLLCVCMLIPMFTACTNKNDNKPLSWEATENQVIPLEMEIQNGDGNTALVLTYGEDVFSSIETEQIKLTVYQKATPSMEEALEGTADESVTERTPTDFTASVTNAKQLTITVPSGENDWGYFVGVHSSAISSGKFGEAFGFKNEVIEDSVSYSASILGEHEVGDVNPVITVILGNTVAAAGLTKDMITLTGLFEGLEITSVSGSESTITIVTSGTVATSTPLFAGVKLAEGATNSGVALSADCDVIYRSAYVKQDSFALTSGTLTFDVVLANDTTTLAVKDTLTTAGITYTATAVSEDKTTVTLGVATTASDLDTAIAEVSGKALEIPANKTASATAHAFVICAIGASVGSSMDYIDETDTANTYSATAILFVKNGAWNGALAVSDITLGGDFDGATVTSVTKDGDSYEIEFTFAKEGLDLEDLSLNGRVTVATDKVKNAWGTSLAATDAEITYVTGLDRGETWDAIMDFIDQNKDTFDKISTVGGAIGGVASAFGGVKTILELVGVLETTDDRLDAINKQLDSLKDALVSLDAKVSKLSQAVTMGNAAIIDKTEYNTYLIASTGWNNFKSSKVDPLESIAESYAIAYNTYILNWISNASTEKGNVEVYLVEKAVNGSAQGEKVLEATMPHPLFSSSNQYSVDGEKLHSVGTYRLEAPLDDVISRIMKNRGKLYDGYWNDIAKSENTVVGVTGEEADISFNDFLQAVQLHASLYALNEVGADKILGEFKNFCNALAGKGGGTTVKPLDYYYVMLSTYYNFYGEAKADIELTQAWLASLLTKYSGLATLAYTYTIGTGLTSVSDYLDIALNELTTNTGKQSSDNYSYVSGTKLDAKRIYWQITFEGKTIMFYEDMKAIEEAEAKYHKDPTDENYKAYGTILSEGVKRGYENMPKNLMSAEDILVMMKRYKRLREAGAITAATFGDYLVSFGILDQSEKQSLSKLRIITDPSYKSLKTFPCDNSVTGNVNWIYRSTWVKPGDSVTVGTNGKFTSEYFKYARCFSSDIIDLEGNVTNDYKFSAYACYSENHWYWINNMEWWDVTKHHDGSMYLFVLS